MTEPRTLRELALDEEDVRRAFVDTMITDDFYGRVRDKLNAKLAGRTSHPQDAREAQLREALQMLYDETADYIRVNNLGDVHHNRSMQLARAALKDSEKCCDNGNFGDGHTCQKSQPQDDAPPLGTIPPVPGIDYGMPQDARDAAIEECAKLAENSIIAGWPYPFREAGKSIAKRIRAALKGAPR